MSEHINIHEISHSYQTIQFLHKISSSDIQFLCAQGIHSIAYGINDISIKYSTIMLEILKWQKIIMKPYKFYGEL